jgi:hypothetical protein
MLVGGLLATLKVLLCGDDAFVSFVVSMEGNE